ncbi:MAG: outer membrane beta-barrel protein, partial [Bacteroidaceae bacterium]|nr:outer membrane beta-barrel protein [Bacteroidaceae bacterium]
MNKKIFLGLITVSLLSANRTFAQSYMTEHQLDSLENSWAAMQDTLKNVEVVAQKRIVKVESDKITYSVKDDSDAKTNNVLDMLRKVPMVTVDGQDNIKVNGSSSFKVYVNGKPNAMISSNPSTILKAMPASVVKNIEVVTNPGAKYDAEGTGGILNITMLTDSSMEGYLANIYAIGGNRVNGGGVYSTIQKKKVTVSLNVGDNYLIQPKIEIENQYDNMATATKQTFKSLTKGWTNSINANTDISVDVDSLNSFSVNGGVSFTPQHTWSDALTDIRGAQNSNYSTHSNNRTRNNNFFAGADYKHNFRGGNGHSLMLAYRLSSQPTRTESESEYSVAYMPAYSEINRSNMVENTLQADYNLPLSSSMRLETGAKYIFRRNTSNTSLLNYRNANDIGA